MQWLMCCVRVVQGMRKGIQDSAAFVLFLSTGVLLRPFCQVGASARVRACASASVRSAVSVRLSSQRSPSPSPHSQFEIREALALQKPIVLLHEVRAVLRARRARTAPR